jgi:hypothetical protein
MTRLWLTIAVVAFFVVCTAAMWWGWHNRGRRQSAYLPALPALPQGLGEPVIEPLPGVYVGTATSGNWQDRIVVQGLGLRSAARFVLHRDGLLIDRAGRQIWIPSAAVVSARADKALAGKVMGTNGLLIVRWRLGDHELDSGLRADDPAVYPAWIAAVESTKHAAAEGEGA